MISPPFILARRFVAGPDPGSAIAAGRQLHARGIRATFDLLGEDVLDREAALRSAEANKQLLRQIPSEIERNISIKLTMFGLDISEEFCRENVASLLDVAREVSGFVRIDMEGSKHTQRTLDLFHRLRETYDNVGIVLQSYLRRTLDDIAGLGELRPNVRLCKGIYVEPPEVAYQGYEEVRQNFVAALEALLDAGCYVGVATHDEVLIDAAERMVAARELGPEDYEFQMLLGVRERRASELVSAGHRVRIYVPFGEEWYSYSLRRLQENPKVAGYIAADTIGRVLTLGGRSGR